jgi:hypothetical protein
MTILQTTKATKTTKQVRLTFELKTLAFYVGQETFLYILRSLYRIIFKSSALKEGRDQLHRRIRGFERQSNLPECLSTIPVNELLVQLEDAQYFYPVQRQEVTLPTFH